jgi:drug/metabolite transporter (DMT)-like permease
MMSSRSKAFAALMAAVLLWGGSFSAARTALTALSPFSLMALRTWIASLAILPFAGRLIPGDGMLRAWRRDGRILLPTVLFQPCLYFLLETNALRFTTSSQAGVISSFVPLMVMIGAWLFLHERLSPRGGAGVVLSICGVAALTLMNGSGGKGNDVILGNMMEMGAMVCAAANMLLIKKLSGRYNPWTLTMFQCFAGALFFSPGLVALIQGGFEISRTSLFLVLYLGAPVSLGAFGLYNWGMSRTTASGASLFINLVPVTAVVLGWLLLDESLNPPQILASAAVLTGVVISQEPSVTRGRKASRSSGSKRRARCSSIN